MKNIKICTIFSFLILTISTYAQWTQLGSDIYGTTEGDQYGRSVSLNSDGTVVAVGSQNNDYVSILEYISGNWVQLGTDIEGSYWFGSSVKINANGTIVVVGAPIDTTSGLYAGMVKVFFYNSGNWEQMGQSIYGAGANDRFGSIVDISADGTIIAVSTNYGSKDVYIYRYIQGTWVQVGDEIDDVYNVRSLSLSRDGNVIAIGTAFHDPFYSNYVGYVRVFSNNNDVWEQEGEILEGNYGDLFGWSVSLNNDGSVLAVGEKERDVDDIYAPGGVSVFKNISGTWHNIGDINGNTHAGNLGSSVSLSDNGSILAIGASYNNSNGYNTGNVQIYTQNNNSSWYKIGQTIGEENLGSQSGNYISLSSDGSAIAIGAPNYSGSPGLVRVYDYLCNDVNNFSLGNDTLICTNDSIIIDAGTGYEYEWSTGDFSQTISVSDTGYYYLTVTAFGCSNSDSIYIGYKATPTSLLLDQTTICPYDTLILNAGIANSYLWNTGSVDQNIQVNSQGTYSVSLNNDNGCTVIDSIEIIHSINPTGIDTIATICLGGELTISANSNNDNVWNAIQNSDEINYTFSNDTTFYLQATDSLSCVINDTIRIIEDSLFTIYTGIKDTVLACYNNNITLYANPHNNNIWNGIYNSDSIIHTVTNDTVFYLLSTNTLGCYIYDSIFIDKDYISNFTFDNTYLSTDTLIQGNPLYLYGDSTDLLGTYTYSEQTEMFIPDNNGNTLTSSINIDQIGIIDQVDQLKNICINMEHSWAGDLEILLTCPNGQSMVLLAYPNGLENDFLGQPVDDNSSNTYGYGYDYCFTNSATDIFQDHLGVYSYIDADGNTYTNKDFILAGDYSPEESFTNLIGCPINGNWTLSVTDNLSSDNGFVFDWSITIDGALPVFWNGENVDNPTNETTYATPSSTGWQNYTYAIENEYGCIYDTTLSVYIETCNTNHTITASACESYTSPSGNYTYVNSGTYLDTLSNTAGCDSILIINLTINNISTGIDTQMACETYTWIDGNTYTEDNNSATFVLINSAGCDSIITLDLTIFQNNINTNLSLTDTSIIADEIDATYRWLNCNDSLHIIGETERIFYPDSSGFYAVELTQNTCVDTSICAEITEISIYELLNPNFSIYPNPTSGKLRIDCFDSVLIKLYDQKANLIKTTNKKEIDISEQAKGVYFIQIITNDGSITKKIILE
jgi:subtilisin-like proprotein convertase family protein